MFWQLLFVSVFSYIQRSYGNLSKIQLSTVGSTQKVYINESITQLRRNFSNRIAIGNGTMQMRSGFSGWRPEINESWMDDLIRVDYDVMCKMQPNSYDCSTWKNKTSIPRYYYDIQMETCLTFDYYECHVSLNNFLTLFECNEHCRAPGPQPIESQNKNIFCRLQPSFGDCHNYHPMYYFDITTRTCKGFSYGGCGGNLNRFQNAQRCVAVCSPVLGAMD